MFEVVDGCRVSPNRKSHLNRRRQEYQILLIGYDLINNVVASFKQNSDWNYVLNKL